MAGPLEDPEGAEYRCQRDPSSQEEVLLLRSECGREGPRPTESTLCTGGCARFYVLPYHSPKWKYLLGRNDCLFAMAHVAFNAVVLVYLWQIHLRVMCLWLACMVIPVMSHDTLNINSALNFILLLSTPLSTITGYESLVSLMLFYWRELYGVKYYWFIHCAVFAQNIIAFDKWNDLLNANFKYNLD